MPQYALSVVDVDEIKLRFVSLEFIVGVFGWGYI
jgi:hypothetical protein